MKTYLLLLPALCMIFLGCVKTGITDRNRVIDESKNVEVVDQKIAIDKVWAGTDRRKK